MSSIRYRDRFAVRVFGYFALALLVVAASFSAVFIYAQTRLLRAQLLEQGQMLARSTSRAARIAVYAEDRQSLDDAVQGLLGRSDVLAVSFLTDDLRVIAAEAKTAAGRARTAAPSAATRAFLSQLDAVRDIEVTEDVATIDVWSVVTLRMRNQGSDGLFFDSAESLDEQQVVGFVRISMDKAVLARAMSQVKNRSLALVLLFFLVGSAVVYPLARRVTTPLAALSAEARAFGRDETVEPVSVKATGEIGVLADSFATMVRSLRAREEEKTRLESRLMHAQKMEAVGTLARGVAHDFNNILSTVRGSVHLLDKKFSDDAVLRKYTGTITNSLDRAKELIEGLIQFSRVTEMRLSPLDLSALITGLEPTLRQIAGDGARLQVALPQPPLFVLGDDLGLKRVLLNLVANARDAMPESGEIRIAVEPGEAGVAKVGGIPADAISRRVRLTVSDTGTGMDAATQQRIFEPFFTTKGVGRGTGLGLAIVYGIVEQHNGRIAVESEPGRGTTLHIDLPRYDPPPAGAPEAGASAGVIS